VFTVEQLVSPSTGCPWILKKNPEDYLKFVCAESEEALVEIVEYDVGEVEYDAGPLVSELGDVLYVALVTVAKASKTYGFDPQEVYDSAVEKIRGRTPYMAEWGDGESFAETCEQAEALWQARKKAQKAQNAAGFSTKLIHAGTSERDAREKLVFTVAKLVSLCPWTARMNVKTMLRFLKDECQEALDEIHALSSLSEAGNAVRTPQDADANEAVLRQALVSELGDVMFDTFMAVFIAARHYGFEPARIYESAVIKIRGRTPYIAAWGDGSKVSTPSEALSVWKACKAVQNASIYAPYITPPS
jgi:NTP pyrophosphatase (non-canonical NTP hydrolase)